MRTSTRVFAPELDGLDRAEIRRWYNGYNWTGEAVYNPFDLLLLFQERQFRPWWFETGTPTFLVELLPATASSPPTWRVCAPAWRSSPPSTWIASPPRRCCFRPAISPSTGPRNRARHWIYTLGYPNHEVASSLNAALLSRIHRRTPAAASRTVCACSICCSPTIWTGLKDLFHAFFASIPNDWYRNNPIARYEGYYASVFYSYFAAVGLDITAWRTPPIRAVST